MPYLDIDGSAIHYESRGEGFPVVFIHAGIVNMGMWDDQMHTLDESFLLIRYDLRGWGESIMNKGDYSDHHDLQSLLSFLEVDKAYLVGASFGGSIAVDLALSCPDLVRGLVLAGTGIDGYEFTKEGFEMEDDALNAAYESGDIALAAEHAARIWVDGQGRSREEVSTAVRSKALGMIQHTFELPDDEGNRLLLEPRAINRLNEIDKPTLLVVGEHDQPDIQAISQIALAGMPGAKLRVIEGTAHFPNMERPAEFNQILTSFFAENSPAINLV